MHARTHNTKRGKETGKIALGREDHAVLERFLAFLFVPPLYLVRSL
jgi:hypothetical protein